MKIAWSHTRLSDFEQCPKMFHHKNILKDVPKPSGEHLIRGRDVHKHLENAVKGTDALPPHLHHCQQLIDGLVANSDEVHAEVQYTLTEGLAETTWFSKTAWVRMAWDVIALKDRVAHVWDWKTGKVKDNHSQLALFAAGVMRKYTWIDEVKTTYIWVDHKKSTSKSFPNTPAVFNGLWQDFSERSECIQLANEAGNWPAIKNKYCHWCPCGPHQCEYRES